MLFPVRLAALAAAFLINATPPPEVPRYDHIFVVVDENKDLHTVVGSRAAPRINALAAQYGLATHYDAVAHPSEPNYVAIVGGDTFGIRNDGSFVKNAVDAPSLATQLDAAHLSWKGYYESIPQPGSLATFSGFYASKHSGFLNFVSVQHDPNRAQHLVGFDALVRDIADNALPSFALIIPNLCNDMHGAWGVHVPVSCWPVPGGGLVKRGDATFGTIADELMKSRAWTGKERTAIVLVFDEDDGDGREGGGGRVPAIVITNHGPRHLVDPTPYTHYSLLRTIEAAFGLPYLRHARTAAPMTRLFLLQP
ncbi:MAG TPA: alkaline phosphatase family protein [Candidatus Aquilonibacter sp.]|nr:alkaline phosphatase family protein [Candidatus Aquilonibacter sp.]